MEKLNGVEGVSSCFENVHFHECVFVTDKPVEGELQCVLTGREIGQNRTKSDIAFVTADGQLVAEMRDVEMYALQS